jgi:hypothetical protein
VVAVSLVSYGGREPVSNAGRTDVDAVLEAKEDLINEYLDSFGEDKPNTLAGMNVVYAGGVRYDIAELQLSEAGDASDNRHYLRVRSSGTEPINRIYVESSSSRTARMLMETVLEKLENLIAREIREAKSVWRIADILTTTKVSAFLLATVRTAVSGQKGNLESLVQKIKVMVDEPHFLEGRNRRMANEWIKALTLK